LSPAEDSATAYYSGYLSDTMLLSYFSIIPPTTCSTSSLLYSSSTEFLVLHW